MIFRHETNTKNQNRGAAGDSYHQKLVGGWKINLKYLPNTWFDIQPIRLSLAHSYGTSASGVRLALDLVFIYFISSVIYLLMCLLIAYYYMNINTACVLLTE